MPKDSSGNLLVNVAAGSGGTPTGTAGTPSASVVSVQGVTSGTPVVANLTQLGGVALSTGNGVVGTGVQRVAIASDSTGFAQISGTVANSTVGLTTNSRNLIYNGSAWDWVKQPNAVSRIVSSAATTNATSGKASAGTLYGFEATNTTAALKFLKIYNKASAPTVGTDTPVMTIPLQPSNVPTVRTFPAGFVFSTGIAYALTGAAADADTTALASADVVGVNIVYA